MSWYFVRLVFLAIPWASRESKNPAGTLFKQCHLLQAGNISSAFEKAESILSASENRSGDGKLRGRRVVYRKIGVLNLEPLYQKLDSGVELFDESEANVSFASIKRRVLSNREKRRLVAYERMKGKPTLLDVYWGEDFDKEDGVH